MNAPRPFVVALSGSPRAGSNVDTLVDAALRGAQEAGAETLHLAARDLSLRMCQACGPDPVEDGGNCIFHDDMDRVYDALERATGVLVATPVFFSGVSAQLKAVIDRCNCVTPVVVGPDGAAVFRRRWARTRRGAAIIVLGPTDTPEPARLTARGFCSWTGGRLLETMVWRHADLEPGAVARDDAALTEAWALGARLAGPPLDPGAAPAGGATGTIRGTHTSGGTS